MSIVPAKSPIACSVSPDAWNHVRRTWTSTPLPNKRPNFWKTNPCTGTSTSNSKLDPRLPHAATDAGQVQQVILNLLENALDAVDHDGTVTLRTWNEPGWIRLRVSDTGPGISSDHLEQVFDPFFTTKDPGEGTGLGLSIIYSTIKRLGGDITVESPPGRGAIFSIRLPLDSRRVKPEEES